MSSIITWKDVAKLSIGITIGLTSSLCIMECNGNENVQTNNVAKINHYQNQYSSTPTKDKLVISGEEVDDYNLFGHDSIGIYKKDEKFGYYNNRTKAIVIPAIYDNAWRFSEGLGGVIKEGKLGFINLKGETIIDFNHAYHESRLYEFIFRWGYCAIPDEKGQCGVVDKKGNWVIQPRYEHADVASPEYAIVSVKNGFNMQVDYVGNIINPYVIDEVERLLYTKQEKDTSTDDYKKYPTSFYKYRVNDNAGLMDGEGHFVTLPIYNNVEAISESLFLATLKDGMSVVVIDGKGNVVNQ